MKTKVYRKRLITIGTPTTAISKELKVVLEFSNEAKSVSMLFEMEPNQFIKLGDEAFQSLKHLSNFEISSLTPMTREMQYIRISNWLGFRRTSGDKDVRQFYLRDGSLIILDSLEMFRLARESDVVGDLIFKTEKMKNLKDNDKVVYLNNIYGYIVAYVLYGVFKTMNIEECDICIPSLFKLSDNNPCTHVETKLGPDWLEEMWQTAFIQNRIKRYWIETCLVLDMDENVHLNFTKIKITSHVEISNALKYLLGQRSVYNDDLAQWTDILNIFEIELKDNLCEYI
jgi:hypothetical protein